MMCRSIVFLVGRGVRELSLQCSLAKEVSERRDKRAHRHKKILTFGHHFEIWEISNKDFEREVGSGLVWRPLPFGDPLPFCFGCLAYQLNYHDGDGDGDADADGNGCDAADFDDDFVCAVHFVTLISNPTGKTGIGPAGAAALRYDTVGLDPAGLAAYNNVITAVCMKRGMGLGPAGLAA